MYKKQNQSNFYTVKMFSVCKYISTACKIINSPTLIKNINFISFSSLLFQNTIIFNSVANVTAFCTMLAASPLKSVFPGKSAVGIFP